MTPHDDLTDETIGAAFQRRANRGDPGDLYRLILAATAATTQRRPWRIRLGEAMRRPLLRVAWMALLLGAALLALAYSLVIFGRGLDTTSQLVEHVWSTTGDGDGMYFSRSDGGGINLDPTGRIWVADAGHERFAIFNPDGSFVEYWGPSADAGGPLKLTRPGGDAYGTIAFAPGGSFYVLDAGHRRVLRFDQDRNLIGAWGGVGTGAGQYVEPVGIAVDQVTGKVYVLDDVRDVVETYEEDGRIIRSFVPHLAGLNSGRGLALDASGNVYVGTGGAAGNQVRKFDAGGALQATFATDEPDQPLEPGGMAIDSAGRLFVARGWYPRYDKVQVFGPEGDVLATFGSPGDGEGQFGYGLALGLALDRQGSVYITNAGANRLLKFRLPPQLFP